MDLPVAGKARRGAHLLDDRDGGRVADGAEPWPRSMWRVELRPRPVRFDAEEPNAHAGGT